MPLHIRKSAKPTAKRPLRSAPPQSLAHLATRIFNTPLCIEPHKLAVILSALSPRLFGVTTPPVVILDASGKPVKADGDGQNWNTDPTDEQPGEDLDNDLDENGVAVIPVYGTLVKRTAGMDAMSGLTSYAEIQAQIAAAMNDPKCSSVVMDFDSPGGEVPGMFELADVIWGMRGHKPIIGVANDAAFSAAYCLAAACDRIMNTTVGGVGSIGCYMLHCDQSGQDAQKGLAYTYVSSGARKTDGNPHAPLSDAALADAQARVDAIRQMFVQSVSRGRSFDAQAIYDTQAGTYYGPAACPMLSDANGTLEDAADMAASMVKGKRGVSMPGRVMLPIGADGSIGIFAGPVPSHKTATTEESWDAGENEKRLPSPMKRGTAKAMYAWIPDGSGDVNKSDCSYPHHMVSADGKPGAANVKACQSGIGALNGARSGTKLSAADKKGVWNHLAKHLRDAGLEPPPLNSMMIGDAGTARFISDLHVEELGRRFCARGAAVEMEVGAEILAIRSAPALALVGTGSQQKISGVLAPYNSMSRDIGGFAEIFQPGCFAEGLRSGSEDPRVLFNHNIDAVLGRMSNGTARFWEEPDGLHYEADLPDTQAARDLRVSIERGDIRESSAAFYITGHRWEKRGNTKVRIIEQARLVEGSPHSFAAYGGSTVAMSPEEKATAERETIAAELQILSLM